MTIRTDHPEWWAERDDPKYTPGRWAQIPAESHEVAPGATQGGSGVSQYPNLPVRPAAPQHVLLLTCGELDALAAIAEVRGLMPRLLARLTQDHNHQEAP